jgi:protein-tyrosine phosphatase
MNWITDQIAIGNFLDAHDIDLLRAEAINSILGLTPALTEIEPAELGVRLIRVVPLEDDLDNQVEEFRQALTALAELLQAAPPVLVHCRAGRSRSVAVVAAHFMARQGWNVDQAIEEIAAKRQIALSPALERFLRQR